jgi:hypothetical protein
MQYLDYLLKPIDYMYYRIAKIYFKRDGKSDITALLSVSLFPTLMLLSIVMIIIKKLYGPSFITEHKTILSVISITLQFILLFLFYVRYKKIKDTLIIRWEREKEPDKTIKGVLVVFALLLPFILLFVDL